MRNTNNIIKYDIHDSVTGPIISIIDNRSKLYDILLRDKRNTPTKSSFFNYLDGSRLTKLLYVLS